MTTNVKNESGIQQAVVIAGSQSELARKVNVVPQTVQKWVESGHVSPAKVKAVEKETGVPREKLCRCCL
ncbi:hypothetical protein DTO96_102420 [Ephemeroptericola cinctiostellae]|uniref:HTH cro/C1-type domain-containing protein n=1 Tax=Ephemeroptericola cinctiostellae TaxID=2268024 RepID=A0A345DE77_9BURK|nr:YdaS family helix-turn-helix protein [Ephemeroptericola cinctiostellae]AXF86665.1 hypothetical protein DTO96_102420 [Ephemeroptericola cinctiostellae]